MEPNIKITVDNGIQLIQVNRPASLNALSRGVLGDLSAAIASLAARCTGPEAFQGIRALILGGEGEKAFVAGADISEMAKAPPAELRSFIQLGQQVMRQLEELPLPVIAAVNGYALGGGLELALACDLIVASDRAKFGFPEVGLGLLPGFGGTQRAAHRIGIGTAKRLVFTGEAVSAEEALSLGLVDWVVPHTDLLPRAVQICRGIIDNGPLGIAAAKRSIESGFAAQKNAGLAHEVLEFLNTFNTEDAREGLSAFAAKRKATFHGR